MKKFFGLALTALICTSQLAQADSDWLLGDEWVVSVEKSYNEGAYADLLAENEVWMSQQEMPPLPQPMVKQPEDESTAEFQKRFGELYMKRRDALIGIVSDAPPSLLRDLIFRFYGDNDDCDEEIDFSLEIHHVKPCFTLSTPFAKAVDEVLKEYWMKETLVVVRHYQNQEISEEQGQELYFLLKLEKLGKLSALCDEMATEDAVDQHIVSLVRNARKWIDSQASIMHDLSYLTALENNEREPADLIEAKVAEVLRDSSQEIRSLFEEKWKTVESD